MSEAGENMDAATALGSSIHLNEDDWLQLLQKLTPSSIDNLQQTLKRIQQRESPILSPEKLNFLGTASQLCGSSLLSPTISESSILSNQNAPLVMSLGVSKAAVPSVITVPSVLNVSKTMPTQLQSTIVLPSTALLIAPSGHSQPISLDSRVPVSGVNRLLFTTGGLPVMSTASSTSIASTSDTFNSLNTLANAAVAVAANASGQTPWSSDLLSTAKTNSIDSAPIPPTSTASDSQLRLGSATATLATRATLDGLLTSLCGSPSAELPTNLLSTNVGTAAGLTVYPIQVSANGPTVFIAAPKNQSPQGLNILGANTLQLATGQSLVQCLSSNAISSNSVPTSCTTPVSPSTLLSINPAPLNSSQTVTAIASSPLSTSTPRNKPKFKALWENSAQGEGDRSSVGNNSDSLSSAESTPARPSSSTDVLTSCATIPVSNQGTLMRPNNTTATRRQSPMLNVKSIGQTPKRLAATAASLTDEQNSFGQEGPKKLLLVCSQPKQQSATQSSTDSGISLASAESLLTRVLHTRTLAGTVVSRVEPEISWTAVSLNPTNSSTDPKAVVVPSQPLLAPANVFVNDLRSNVCSSNNNVPSSDHDMPSTALGSRVESVVNKSFDGSRRLMKEESVGEDEARRRAKRRERNRVAAARCRQRRQDQIVELQHRVGVLTKTGEELRTSLQTLEHERTRLEGLIRQHGLAGCVEAEELLSRMALERSELSMHDNVASVSTPVTHLKSDDLVPNFSSTTTPPGPISPSVILVTNTLVTKPEPDCNEVTLTSIRPSLAKLDLRRQTQPTCAPNVVISAISASNCLGNKLNSEPSSRADDFGTSNSSTVYRLAARPSTLIPDRLLTEVTQLADKALGGNTGASTTTTAATTTSTTISGTPIEIPTPGFWPSDLQTFSPILTPSTWRLLKNLTSSTCNTPQSFILTPTFSSACPTISLANMGTPTPAASSSTSVPSGNPFTSVVDSNNDSVKSALTADSVVNSVTTAPSSSSTEQVPDTGEEAPTSSVTPSEVSDKDGPGVEPDGDSASGDPSVTLGRSLGQTYFLSFSTRCDNAEHGTVTNTTLAN